MVSQTEKEEKKYGLIITIFIALFMIGFAILNILNLSSLYGYIILAMGSIVMLFGIVRMILYFKKNEYKSINNFGFSLGIFCLVVGLSICLNSNALVNYFAVTAGIIIVAFGAIMLQHAVAMKILNSPQWALSFIYSIFSIFIGLVILLDMFKITSPIDIRFHCFVIVTSCLYIISVITNYAATKKYSKNIELGQTRNMEEEPNLEKIGGNKVE